MQKFAVTVIAGAAILIGTACASAQGWQPWEGVRPGYYAYTQLVYGSASRHYAYGCARWGWHNRSWYNYCCAGLPPRTVVRKRAIAVKG